MSRNVEAVKAQLEDVTVVPGLQESALSLAAVMDETSSARDIATSGRELRQTLVAVSKAHADSEAAKPAEPDLIDQLRSKRLERRGAL